MSRDSSCKPPTTTRFPSSTQPAVLLKGRYRILDALGKGGCGETFLAVDTHKPSKPKCVIKQLKPATTDAVAHRIIRERFAREAAILETLHSDQIPTLHAYFTEADEFYLVEDWIDGTDLKQKVREQGIFSETRVKGLLINLLPVLEYIHSRGIIHRDIKPDNIILRQCDGTPVLIDFGAVKEAVTTVVDSCDAHNSTIVVGTPGFMSPEQAARKPVIASDLYSLGLTAIYLLTGKHPGDFIDSLAETVSWRAHATNISSHFSEILGKAVQWRAPARYQTAREMLTALQSADVRLSPISHTDQSGLQGKDVVTRNRKLGRWLDSKVFCSIRDVKSSLFRLFQKERPVFLNWEGDMRDVYWGEDYLWWRPDPTAGLHQIPQVVVLFGHPDVSDSGITISLDATNIRLDDLVTEGFDYYNRTQKGKTFFDGEVARVKGWNATTRELAFQGVSFFDFLKTNLSLDRSRFPLPTLRETSIIEGKLQPFDKSILANATGVNGLAFSNDGFMVFQVRNEKVVMRPNQACSAFSGFIDKSDIENAVSQYSNPTLANLDRVRELFEEVGIRKREIKGYTFLGITRELHRGGMPELFYAVDVELSKDEILDRFHRDDEGLVSAVAFGPFARRLPPDRQDAHHNAGPPPLRGLLKQIEQTTGATISIPFLTNLVLWYRNWSPSSVGQGRHEASGDAS